MLRTRIALVVAVVSLICAITAACHLRVSGGEHDATYVWEGQLRRYVYWLIAAGIVLPLLSCGLVALVPVRWNCETGMGCFAVILAFVTWIVLVGMWGISHPG